MSSLDSWKRRKRPEKKEEGKETTPEERCSFSFTTDDADSLSRRAK